MTIADALVGALGRLGVEYVFGLPGSTEGPLLDALSRVEQPVYVLGLHENVVTAMADGYARVSGRPGVVSLHTSVGTGNAVSQVMNAKVDRSPVVAIVGHKDRRIANRDGFCTVEDLPGLLRPWTKWSRQVEAPELAVEDLERAVQLAMAQPRGPVSVVVTEDRAAAADAGTATRSPGLPIAAGTRPDRDSIRALARLLAEADRPVLMAGDGVAWSNAGHLLEDLATRMACPVVQEPRRSASRFNCSTEFANYCGEYGPSHPAVKDADLVVALGARVFVEFEPRTGPEFPPGARLVHLHEDPREIGLRHVPDLGLVGTVRDTLEDLRDVLAETGVGVVDPDRVRRLREQFESDRAARRDAAADGPLTTAVASRVIDEELSDDVVLIDEGIRSSRVLLQHLSVPSTREYHRNTGGAIGWGLPAAVGACFAVPDRPVALFVGDGSALMTIQALWTAARHTLPLTVLVSNNRGYQAVQAAVEKHRESRLGHPAVGAAIRGPDPDFVGLAESLGVAAMAVETAEELRTAMSGTREIVGPRLIELRLADSDHVGQDGRGST